MADTKIVVKIAIRFPWWMRLYIEALKFYQAVGGYVDQDIAADFIVKHTKFGVRDGR